MPPAAECYAHDTLEAHASALAEGVMLYAIDVFGSCDSCAKVAKRGDGDSFCRVCIADAALPIAEALRNHSMRRP